MKIRLSRKSRKRYKKAPSTVRHCIRWLRGEGFENAPRPFSMNLVAFDLEVALADLTGTPRPDPIDPIKVEPDGLLMINKTEAEALLSHYHKYGIPVSQVAAKRLEKRLCDFTGKEPKDEFIPKEQR